MNVFSIWMSPVNRMRHGVPRKRVISWTVRIMWVRSYLTIIMAPSDKVLTLVTVGHIHR